MAATVRLKIKSFWSEKASDCDSQSIITGAFIPLKRYPPNMWRQKLKIPFVLFAEPTGSEAAVAGLLSHHIVHGKSCSAHSVAQISAPSLFLRAWKMIHSSFLGEKKNIFQTLLYCF